MELELSLLSPNWETELSHHLHSGIYGWHYHLIIPRPDLAYRSPTYQPLRRKGGLDSKVNLLEVVVKRGTGDRRGCKEKFFDACEELVEQGQSRFLAQVENEQSPSAFHFHIYPPMSPMKSYQEVSFSEVLRNLTSTKSQDYLPMTERANLAYKIAECGLLLLGTSWLSDLRSGHLIRAVATGKFPRYRVMVRSNAGQNDNVSYDSRLQTINIGVLLLEIALGELRRGRKAIEGHLESVEKSLGQGYSGAIKFCLQTLPSKYESDFRKINKTGDRTKREALYCSMLDEYYTQVYLPYCTKRSFQKYILIIGRLARLHQIRGSPSIAPA